MNRTVRLDLNEDGWVTLTAFAGSLKDLKEAVNKLERVYIEALKTLIAEAGDI